MNKELKDMSVQELFEMWIRGMVDFRMVYPPSNGAALDKSLQLGKLVIAVEVEMESRFPDTWKFIWHSWMMLRSQHGEEFEKRSAHVQLLHALDEILESMGKK
ncbi:MAG: hypothetical protein RIC84_08685 [Aggregatilineales bacterium]